MKPSRTSTPVRRLLWIAAGLAVAWTAGACFAPALEAWDAPAAWLTRLAYAPLCHQDPGRSLAVWGRPLAVCSRCTGLYVAGAAALVAVALRGRVLGFRGPRWLAIAAVPTGVDVAVRLAGWPGAADVPRLLTALPLGAVAGLLLADAVADLASRGDPTRRSKLDRACPTSKQDGIGIGTRVDAT